MTSLEKIFEAQQQELNILRSQRLAAILEIQNSKIGGYMDGQELKGGNKKDEGKPRWELVPYDAIEQIAIVLTHGAKKYEARNWEKGINYSRIFGAIMRHLWKFWHAKLTWSTGLDPESGLSHLSHAFCELAFLVAYEKRKLGEFDDRPEAIVPGDAVVLVKPSPESAVIEEPPNPKEKYGNCETREFPRK